MITIRTAIQASGKVGFSYADNGPGTAEVIDPKKKQEKTLGTQLISMLSQQLEGIVVITIGQLQPEGQ